MWQCGFQGAAWSVDIRPDGRGMVTGGADKLVKFWEVSVLHHSALNCACL